MTEKIFNINAMRPALERARDRGNKRPIDKKMCLEMGITEGYFAEYEAARESVFNAVVSYAFIIHNPAASDEQKNESLDDVRAKWRNLMSHAEADSDQIELLVDDSIHSIVSLIGLSQRLGKDCNDVSRGADKNFVAKLEWVAKEKRPFYKDMEAMIGIAIKNVEMQSNERRDFLRAEGSILSKWKRSEAEKKELDASVLAMKTLLKSAETDEMKKYLREKIKEADKKIADCVSNIEAQSRDHKTLTDYFAANGCIPDKKSSDEKSSEKKPAAKPEKKPAAKKSPAKKTA